VPDPQRKLDLTARAEHKPHLGRRLEWALAGFPVAEFRPLSCSLAASLVGAALLLSAGSVLAQDDDFGGFGPSPMGGRPPAPKGKPKQPAKAGDEPEHHAASGAEETMLAPGSEPTLPTEPLKLDPGVLGRIGSDAALDEFPLGQTDELQRRFYGVFYEESYSGGYRFRTILPPLWLERTQPSASNPSVVDRASLFGFYYNRRSADRADDILFPLFWNLRDHDSRSTVVGPFFNRVAPGETDNWLAPLFFTGTRPDGAYTIIPPLLTYLNHDKEGGFSLIGPYFCSWEGAGCSSKEAKDLDLGVAPFYFYGKTEETSYRLIPPLLHYHHEDRRDLSSLDVWGPVYRRHEETRDYLHIFPFYYSIWGQNERHTTLLPFFHYGHEGDSFLLINPLFLKSRDEEGHSTFITWGYANYRGRTELDMITPLWWHYRDPDIGLDQKLLFPFFFSRQSPRENTLALFPFYAHIERTGLSRTTWVTPLFQHSTGLRGWSTNIFPLFYFGREGYDTHTVVAPFFWDFATRSSRATVGFPLYWRFSEQDSVSQLVGNVYYQEHKVQNGTDWEIHIFPAFSYGETPDGHWWNVLYGLAGYTRRGTMTKVRTFWVPITLSE
jgi:hypothetical protein